MDIFVVLLNLSFLSNIFNFKRPNFEKKKTKMSTENMAPEAITAELNVPISVKTADSSDIEKESSIQSQQTSFPECIVSGTLLHQRFPGVPSTTTLVSVIGGRKSQVFFYIKEFNI